MSYYEDYRKRMEAMGGSLKNATENVTKINQHNMILNSPSRSDIRVGDSEEEVPAIVSDIETYEKRRFLFVPDFDVKLGMYIYHDNFTYLATDKKTGEIYPEAFCDFCNKVIDISLGFVKIDTGKKDFQGKPIIKEEEIIEKVPVHINTKIYSALSNHPISLPTGAIIVKVPYKKEYQIPLNYVIEFDKSEYKVIDVVYKVLAEDEGILEVHAQREVVSSE